MRFSHSGVLGLVDETGIPNQKVSGLWPTLLNEKSVALAWDSLSTAIEYHVYIRVSGVGDFHEFTRTEKSSISINGLSNYVLYDVRISAANRFGSTSASSITIRTTGSRPIDPVSSVVVQEMNTSAVTLVWFHVTDAFVYLISDGEGINQQVFAPNATISGLTENREYLLTIYAGNNFGFEPTGQSLTVRPRAIPPSVDNLVTLRLIQQLIQIQWDAVPSADRYLVEIQSFDPLTLTTSTFEPQYEGNDSEAPWWGGAWNWTIKSEFDSLVALQYSINITDPSLLYTIRVRAGNFHGFEEVGSYIMQPLQPSNNMPSFVTNLRVAKLTPETVRLEWSPPASAFFYHILTRSPNSGWQPFALEYQNIDPQPGTPDDFGVSRHCWKHLRHK